MISMLRVLPDGQGGYAKTRDRRLSNTKMHPKAVIGKRIFLFSMSEHLQQVRKISGWGPDISTPGTEKQAHLKFRFSGEAFRNYEEKLLRGVLGREIKGIYFPAVWTSVVASALASAGYELFAGDVSPYWVENAKRKGLRAEVRGFEQMPTREEFNADAVVSFEPHCVDPVCKHILLLRAFARGIPYTQIFCGYTEQYDYEKIPGQRSLIRRVTYLEEMGIMRYRKQGYYPQIGILRVGYDYGAKYYDHVVYKDSGFLWYACGTDPSIFRISTIVPTAEVVTIAATDLRVMEEIDRRFWRRRISIRELALAVDREIEEVAASVWRILKLRNEGYVSYFSVPSEIVE